MFWTLIYVERVILISLVELYEKVMGESQDVVALRRRMGLKR